MSIIGKKPAPRREGNRNGFDNLIKKFKALSASIDLMIAASMMLVAVFLIFVEGEKLTGLLPLLLAAVFAILGMQSVFRDMKGTKRLLNYTSISQIADLDRYEVRELVTTLYSLQGYVVSEADELDRRQADFDMLACKGKKSVLLIRCRDWDSSRIPLDVVKRVKAAITGNEATGAVIISTGNLAQDACEYAQSKGITLVLGVHILEMIGGLAGVAAEHRKADTQISLAAAPVHEEHKENEVPREDRPSNDLLFVDERALVGGADLLDRFLSENPTFRIISHTGTQGAVDQLKVLLPAHANRVLVKPCSPGDPLQRDRYLAVKRYLNLMDGHARHWAILDTHPSYYPEATTELVAVSPDHGINETGIAKLNEILFLQSRHSSPIV